jgi:hypothetical protein
MKNTGILSVLAISILVGLTTGCGDTSDDTSDFVDTTAAGDAMAADNTDVPHVDVLDTTAEAIWAHLSVEDYATNWQMWPGKEPFYKGREPHGALLTTYLNPTASTALAGDAEAMPVGSIIVKENYKPDSTLMAITTIMKVDGYEPEHNNWYWTKFLPDGSIEATGRVQSCIDCHSKQMSNDYLFTGPMN